MFSLKDPGHASLIGDLTMDSVSRLLEPGRQAIREANKQFEMDLSAVGAVSSVAVALLIDWFRVADESGVKLHIKGLPDQMQSIIQVSDLSDLFESALIPS